MPVALFVGMRRRRGTSARAPSPVPTLLSRSNILKRPTFPLAHPCKDEVVSISSVLSPLSLLKAVLALSPEVLEVWAW
jgi:hypothetical protein